MSRNDVVKDFLQQYSDVSNQIELPQFLSCYHVVSCVYERTEKSCYLVADRKTDEKYLLKIRNCKDNRNVLELEHQRICQLAQAFPEEYKTSLYWKENDTEYLLKPYIQGVDLEKYQEKNRILSVQEILRIVIGICEKTTKLHALTPPVLHRDIKPKNLIIDYRGNVHLIDFETSRYYKENKGKDTVFFGTEGNAAPEQYGYCQTDVRTDVYGIGKVLEFLYNENADSQTGDKMLYRKMQKIIKKAVAFDPAHRYQSISEMQCALEKVMNRVDGRYLKRKLWLVGAVEAAAAIFLIFAAFFMAVNFHKQPKDTQPEKYAAQAISEHSKTRSLGEEPVTGNLDEKPVEQGTKETYRLFDGGMEEAIKTLLGKEKIAEEDYARITRLVVIGNQIYGMETDWEIIEEERRHREFDSFYIKGKITDLSALPKMKNLKEVFLCDQNITDIRPLAGLPIESLYLAGNQIKDFSTVETLEQLRVLSIADNPISVLPDISKCKFLETIVLDENTYESLDFLENSMVGTLYLCNVYVNNDDFSVLSRMPNLNYVYSLANQYSFYEELPNLSQLKGLALWEYIGRDLSIIKSLPEIEFLVVTGDMVKSMEGVENAVNIHTFCIDGTAITDISLVKKLHRLTYFKVNRLAIEDYSPLFECDSLRTVSATANQNKKIDSINSNHIFQISED